MRILLAAKHSPYGLRPIGGVQSWSKTVGQELMFMGHDVNFWEPGMRADGIFDVGLIANYACTNPVLKLCKQYLVICHGIIKPEQPPHKNVAFTAEGVRDYWQGDGPIIRQPINLHFWKMNEESQRHALVRFSYREGVPEAKIVADRLGLSYSHIRNKTHEEIRDGLSSAVCALASGRAALEAMACGVPVVIVDDRHYQGTLLDVDTVGSMSRNYSGRGGAVPTVESLISAVKEAVDNGSLRQHVEQYHDAAEITNQLLEAAS